MIYQCEKCKSILISKNIDNYMLKFNDEVDYVKFDEATIYDEFVYCCPNCKEQYIKREFIIIE